MGHSLHSSQINCVVPYCLCVNVCCATATGVNPTAVNKYILKTWCMNNTQFIVHILMLLPCLWVAAEQGGPVFSSASYSRSQMSPLNPELCRYASNGIQERNQLDPVHSNLPQHHMYFLQAAHNPVLL